jgi:MCP family monocarboxylic acid transporter-like MFS transporter 10
MTTHHEILELTVHGCLGAVIHPIMLNKLFHGPIGFQNGVRISAALNCGLLIIANLMMRTRLPPKSTGTSLPIAAFARDPPYLLAVIGYVMTILLCGTTCHSLLVFRGMFVICGLFFPIFFLQLDAVTHGVDHQFSFYVVSILVFQNKPLSIDSASF